MTNQPFNSPFFVFHAAKDFFEKGTLAASENFKEKENEIKQFDTLIHPKLCMPIVNIMFSLELMLKGMSMQSTGKFSRGHDILKLFEVLSSDLRDRIVKHYQAHDTYKQYLAIRLVAADGTEHNMRFAVPALKKDEKGVRELLSTHKDYFQDFRYLFRTYENGEIRIYFREISNFSFSTLVIFGEMLNIKVESKKRDTTPG